MANAGKVFGVELLSPQGCRRALEPQTDGPELVMGLPITYCMGYAKKSSHLVRHGSDEGMIFWGGAGGSSIVVDTDAHSACLT